jgi:hypothetical protein
MEQVNGTIFSKNCMKLQEKNSILVYFFAAICLPFVFLSFFNHPATDDYYFVNLIQNFGIKDANIWLYQNWGGRYIANGILGFCPLYFGQLFWYKVIPVLLFFIWIFTTYYFIKQSIPDFKKRDCFKITAVILLLFLALTDEITSAFYWIVGGITHFLPVCFLLLSVGLYLKYLKQKNLLFFVGSVFFIALTMGCNENIVITVFGLFILILIQNFIIQKNKNYSLYILFVIAVLFGSFELFAPGNFARAETIPVEKSLLSASVKSIIHSVIYTLKWVPLIAFSVLILLPEIQRINTSKLFLQNKTSVLLSLFLPTLILIPNLFLGFYLQSNILPDRSLNGLLVLFIILNLYVWTGFINFYKNSGFINFQLSDKNLKILTAIFILFLLSDSPILFAITDVTNGKAIKYNQEMNNRIAIIKNAKTKKVIVPALQNKPKTIYSEVIMGLTDNPKDWKNEDISIYFKKEVVVKPTDSVFVE